MIPGNCSPEVILGSGLFSQFSCSQEKVSVSATLPISGLSFPLCALNSFLFPPSSFYFSSCDRSCTICVTHHTDLSKNYLKPIWLVGLLTKCICSLLVQKVAPEGSSEDICLFFWYPGGSPIHVWKVSDPCSVWHFSNRWFNLSVLTL